MGPAPVVSISSNAAPRSPFGFVGRAGRAARALTTGASALALAVGALMVAPAPVLADDGVTTQDYFSYYHLDSARAKGYTGKGVTIAVIDGPVELSDPELAGANITDKSRCTIEASIENRYHGSEMAAILASQKYGVAPDATILSYQVRSTGDHSAGTCDDGPEQLDSFATLINNAIDDGAQIISISHGSTDHGVALKMAIARAMSEGVIIVASVGNNGKDENDTHLSWWSGVVGVSAITTDGQFASYSSWGNGVTTSAVGGPLTVRDFDTGKTATTNGTSNSTALVAGMLALALQKWPNATPNQILQSLVRSGLNPNHDWDKYTGYGAAALGSLVNTDPSQYPDENPLAQKQGGSSPTPEEVQDYADGTIRPNTVMNEMPKSYIYRGTDEDVLFGFTEGLSIHLGTSPRYHRK